MPPPVVPVFAKLTPKPVHWGAVEVNDAVGAWFMVIVKVLEAKQPVVGFVMVSVTVLEPPVEYITPVGLCALDVAGLAPAPKLHEYTTPTAVPVLVKFTLAPVH